MIRANPKGAATSGIIPTNGNANEGSRIAIPIISTPARSARPIAGQKPANAPIRAIATDKRDSSSLPHQYTQNRRVPGALLRMTTDGLQFRKASGLAAGKTSAVRPELQLNPAAVEDEAEDGGAVGAGAAEIPRGAEGRGDRFGTALDASAAADQ